MVLGDFNMRDAENSRIAGPYCDVWPALRPDEEGFTEDTSINLMRYDMKDKHRHVRFDRVLLKGRQWAAADIELLGTEPIAAEFRGCSRRITSAWNAVLQAEIHRPTRRTHCPLSATAVATAVPPCRVPTTVTSSLTASEVTAFVFGVIA